MVQRRKSVNAMMNTLVTVVILVSAVSISAWASSKIHRVMMPAPLLQPLTCEPIKK